MKQVASLAASTFYEGRFPHPLGKTWYEHQLPCLAELYDALRRLMPESASVYRVDFEGVAGILRKMPKPLASTVLGAPASLWCGLGRKALHVLRGGQYSERRELAGVEEIICDIGAQALNRERLEGHGEVRVWGSQRCDALTVGIRHETSLGNMTAVHDGSGFSMFPQRYGVRELCYLLHGVRAPER